MTPSPARGRLDTDWVEADALLALLREDEDDAREVLKELLPGELRTLARACGALAVLCHDERRRKEAGR